jgi:hypothetical protein
MLDVDNYQRQGESHRLGMVKARLLAYQGHWLQWSVDSK